MNEFGHCAICGCRIRLRFQAGYFNIPVSIYCPDCQSHISGSIYLDDKKGYSISLFNYICDKEQHSDGYMFELSTEFLAKKCCKNDLEKIDLTPYLRNFGCDKSDGYYLQYLLVISENAQQYKVWIETLFHLLNSKKTKFISKYIFSINEPRMKSICQNIKDNIIQNQLDAIVYTKDFVSAILDMIVPKSVSNQFLKISEEVNDLIRFKKEEFLRYINFLEKAGYFDYFYKIIPRYICEYLEHIKELLPIHQRYDRYGSIDLKKEGITTMSVSNIHHLYAKGFEIICDSTDAFWGLSNIINYGEYDNFGMGRVDYEVHINKYGSKYIKFNEFCKKNQKISDQLLEKPNNIIRNSEAHNSLIIDGLNQTITFISHNKEKEKREEYFFVELGKKEIDLFYSILIIWEYYYNIVKSKLKCDVKK